MKRFFFHMKQHKKLERSPFSDLLISYLVPELQTLEDTRIKAKSANVIYRNQSKLIKFVMSHTLLVDLVNN